MTFSVEIEVEGIDLSDLNMTEIQTTISDLTGIEADKLRIQVDTNDNNEVIRIIVIVDDKETADKVSKSINSAIEEHNEQGIIRHFKSAKVVTNEKNLSISRGTKKEERTIIIFTIAFITFIIHSH